MKVIFGVINTRIHNWKRLFSGPNDDVRGLKISWYVSVSVSEI